MSTLISGLNEADCRDFVGNESWNKHAVRWCASDKLAAETGGQQMIWLYRAPWSALGLSDNGTSDVRGDLAHWLQQNRAILNMRRQFSDNLLLVNADRVRPADLRARLAGNAATQDTADDLPASTRPSYENLLGQLFHWSAPQYWNVLEALEAASWLSSGEPLFRGNCTAGEDQLHSLLDTLRSHSHTGNRELEQENSELKQEGELLLLQLHQVQEELEQYYLKNLDLDKSVTAGRKAASDTQKVLTQDRKALAVAQRETKALHLQLQQMQEELKHQQALLSAPAAQPASKSSTLARWVPSPARRMISHSRDKKARLAQLEIIRKSSWFDRQWYLDTYPDIRAAKIDPVEHYLTTGWRESRNPCSGFNTAYYLRTNPDITQSGLNPLWHFIAFGSKEGRLPRKP